MRIPTKNEAMIYLLEEDNSPMSEDKTYLFEVPDAVNPDAMYKNQMLRLAEEIGAVINPELLYIEDHHPYHSKLDSDEYWKLSGRWITKRLDNTLLDFMRKNFTEINYVRI